MAKPDEIELYNILRLAKPAPGIRPNDIAKKIDMPEKRCYYLLGKWTKKDWWEYGVSLRTGWFTKDAPELLGI